MKTSIHVKVLLYAIVTGVYYLSCYYVLDGKLPCVYRTSYALWLGMIWKMGGAENYSTSYQTLYFANVISYLFHCVYSIAES